VKRKVTSDDTHIRSHFEAVSDLSNLTETIALRLLTLSDFLKSLDLGHDIFTIFTIWISNEDAPGASGRMFSAKQQRGTMLVAFALF
jgi:hypothetical protein